jgi:hypothetical protein
MALHSLNTSVLDLLATDQTAQENSIGEDRLTYFSELAANTTETEFRDLLRDWKNQHKDAAGKVDVVVGVRASEFQALYFGLYHAASYAHMGYKAAVVHARKHLESLGMRGNGKPVLDDDMKLANREKNLRRKAATEAAKVVDFGQPDALVKLQAEIDNQAMILRMAAAQKEVEKKFEKVAKLVESIMGDGEDYATEVWDQLGKALGFVVEETTEVEEDQPLIAKAA